MCPDEMYLRLVHATALHHGIDVLLPQLWLPVVVAHIGIYLFKRSDLVFSAL